MKTILGQSFDIGIKKLAWWNKVLSENVHATMNTIKMDFYQLLANNGAIVYQWETTGEIQFVFCNLFFSFTQGF